MHNARLSRGPRIASPPHNRWARKLRFAKYVPGGFLVRNRTQHVADDAPRCCCCSSHLHRTDREYRVICTKPESVGLAKFVAVQLQPQPV